MPKQVDYVGMVFNHPVYGEYEVIKDLGLTFKLPSGKYLRRLRVKFKNTGYTVDTLPDSALHQKIKDPYYPVLAGVGYFGQPEDFDSKINNREYNVWFNMISKCYNTNFVTYNNFGGNGITVCKEWHNFANFFRDFKNYSKCELWKNDKSYGIGFRCSGITEYSFENCASIENGGSNALKTTQYKKRNKLMYHLITPENTPEYIGKKFTHPIYGEYTIIHDSAGTDKNKMVTIRFTNTGYEKIVLKQKALNCQVRDPYYITKFGVGYIGETDYIDFNRSNERRIKSIWNMMLSRCYNTTCDAYTNYGAKGVTVCKRWHCYANFLQDFINMDNYDKWATAVDNAYHLDKDYLQQGIPDNQKVYSPETCMLVPASFNIALANANRSNNTYIGVSKINNTTNNIYRTNFRYHNNYLIYDTYFDNEYHAAVYRDYYARAYGIPTMYNNVPIDDAAFREAQSHRVQNVSGAKFEYKQMYHLVDKSK